MKIQNSLKNGLQIAFSTKTACFFFNALRLHLKHNLSEFETRGGAYEALANQITSNYDVPMSYIQNDRQNSIFPYNALKGHFNAFITQHISKRLTVVIMSKIMLCIGTRNVCLGKRYFTKHPFLSSVFCIIMITTYFNNTSK